MKKLVKLIEMLLMIFSIVGLECAILGRLNAKLSWTTVVEKVQKAKLPQAVANFLRIFSREEKSEKNPPKEEKTDAETARDNLRMLMFLKWFCEDKFGKTIKFVDKDEESEEADTDDFEDEQP